MREPDSVDELTRELRRFREELPTWANVLDGQEAHGENTGGSVRASCTVWGDVTRVEFAGYFLRAADARRAEAAILEALQSAQAAAERMMAAHQEKLSFGALPLGEVLSGKRSLSDLLGIPSSAPRSEEGR